MGRSPASASTWAVVRLVAAALILAAVLAQAWGTIGGAVEADRDLGTTIVNFFSFFTILSNIASVLVLTWGPALRPGHHRRLTRPTSGQPETRARIGISSVSTPRIEISSGLLGRTVRT